MAKIGVPERISLFDLQKIKEFPEVCSFLINKTTFMGSLIFAKLGFKSGYYNIRLRNTPFGYLFYFSDVFATCSALYRAIIRQF
jgi:hypothetical protein